MKRIYLFLVLLLPFIGFSQTFTNNIKNITSTGGAVAITINYTLGTYWTNEEDFILASRSDTTGNTFELHAKLYGDSGKGIDTVFVLSSTQLNALNTFYQSANTGSNPNPILSATSGATNTTSFVVKYSSQSLLSYNSSIHVSLVRYLLSNWNNWQ